VQRLLTPKAPPPSTAATFRFVGKIRAETERALLVAPWDTLLGPRRVWLPRSQVRIVDQGDEFDIFEIPSWLARTRGFLGV
jgi:hypothetical protein